MTITLEHKKGRVFVAPAKSGKSLISVYPNGWDHPKTRWKTSYPTELIQAILAVKGVDFLCDEIRRDEDPAYTSNLLWYAVSAYMDKDALENGRVLDFGCGSGASAMIFARMFDNVSIVGVERARGLIDIAKKRARHYGLSKVQFLRSPSDSALPTGLGKFDCVLLNAVYEHLLPKERKALAPEIWNLLKPGGIMFVNETPNRYFPMETHTTGLPFINYLPDRAALFAARRFSGRVRKDETWGSLLRRGIRGASPNEILRTLENSRFTPVLLKPTRLGIKNANQIWFEAAIKRQMPFFRKTAVFCMKAVLSATGLGLSPYLCLAIKKEPKTGPWLKK